MSRSPFRYVNAKFNSALRPRTLLRKTPRLVFVLSCLLFTSSYIHASQTYILSYRAQVKNAVVISESYHFTRAMKELIAHPSEQLSIYSRNDTDIETILKKNKDEIINFLMKEGLHTRSHEKLHNYKSSSLICISIPPTYITVDFNDDYATITRLITD